MAESMKGWVEVIRNSDGHRMMIPEIAYDSKNFEKLSEGNESEESTAATELELPITADNVTAFVEECNRILNKADTSEVGYVEVGDISGDEEIIDDDEELVESLSDSFEVEEVVEDSPTEERAPGNDCPASDLEECPKEYTLKMLDNLSYAEIKDLAKEFDPNIKGNASRDKCYEVILGGE